MFLPRDLCNFESLHSNKSIALLCHSFGLHLGQESVMRTFGPAEFMGLHVLASANSHPVLPSVKLRMGYPEINLEIPYLSAKGGKLAGRQMFKFGCEILPP